jgi:hypothetical protein
MATTGYAQGATGSKGSPINPAQPVQPQPAFTALQNTPLPASVQQTTVAAPRASATQTPAAAQSTAARTPAGAVSVVDLVSRQVQNPNLPAGTSLTPVLMNPQTGEFMNPQAGALDSITGMTTTQAAVTPGQVSTETIPGLTTPAPQVQAALNQGQNLPQAVAAQGQVAPEATVQGQLQNLMNFQAGETPAWAKGSVALAQDVLAARGLGSSSIAAGTIVQALQNAALPIAQQDAQTYFQMSVANLSNEQQTRLENLRVAQQAMFTDTAALNAARQFNATNDIQVRQFQANLVAQVRDQNANRAQAITQFNTEQDNAVKKFNTELVNQRQQFEAQARFAIDQSNVLWRRSINTANTAAVNAANQFNVQNRFNISQTALNNTWQQWRDAASWAFMSSENAANRSFNLAVAANNRQYAEDVYQRDRKTTMASAAAAIFTDVFMPSFGAT